VINLAYIATTPDEIALLAEQQKFFFSVLEQTVLTPDGLLIIRNHSTTGNATAAYSALVDRYGKSTAAELAATEIENDLIEFRMEPLTKRIRVFCRPGLAKVWISMLSLLIQFLIPRNASGSLVPLPLKPSSLWLSLTSIPPRNLHLVPKAPLMSRPPSLTFMTISPMLLLVMIKLTSFSKLAPGVLTKPRSLLVIANLSRTSLPSLAGMVTAILLSSLLINGKP
jgi:hypothetical protein